VALVQASLHQYAYEAYLLETVTGLMDGIARLRQVTFDVVLLDLGLPECEGAESYLVVRDNAPDVPVLVFTADRRQNTVRLVIAYGAQGYLLKQEASGQRLIEAIRRVTFLHKANGAVPAPKFDGVAWQCPPTPADVSPGAAKAISRAGKNR
jgi:DNA-binding NarL/FixJ family response regulator